MGIIFGDFEGITNRVVKRCKVGVKISHVGCVRGVTREYLTQKHVKVSGRNFLRGAVRFAPTAQEEQTLPSSLDYDKWSAVWKVIFLATLLLIKLFVTTRTMTISPGS